MGFFNSRGITQGKQELMNSSSYWTNIFIFEHLPAHLNMHSDLLTAQAILEFYSFTQQLLAIIYNLSNIIITYYIALGRLLRLNKFQMYVSEWHLSA